MIRFVLMMLVLMLPLAAHGQKRVRYDKLPDGVEKTTKVAGKSKVVTAEQRLRELGARYRKGILVDAKGREIRFFTPLCRGMQPAEDDGADAAKAKELADLKKKFTVVEIVCDRMVSVLAPERAGFGSSIFGLGF